MKKTILRFAVVALVLSGGYVSAQQTGEETPRFTLKLSHGKENAYFKGVFSVLLTETNVSNRELHESTCIPAMFDPKIKISIIFNGHPLEMDASKPAAQVRRTIAEGTGHCLKSMLHVAQPGGGPKGAFEDKVNLSALYDMSRPGSYKIVVSKESNTNDPKKSVTIKSNEININVRAPANGESQP